MPPLRTKEENIALVKGLESGAVDFVTTDHRPKDIERKFKEFDHASFGSVGLESGFGALNKVLTDKMALEKIISLICQNPRKRFGLETPKVEVGAKVELTLFNPDAEFTFEEKNIKSLSKNSAFVGKELKGEVYGVVAKGELVIV